MSVYEVKLIFNILKLYVNQHFEICLNNSLSGHFGNAIYMVWRVLRHAQSNPFEWMYFYEENKSRLESTLVLLVDYDEFLFFAHAWFKHWNGKSVSL